MTQQVVKVLKLNSLSYYLHKLSCDIQILKQKQILQVCEIIYILE